MRDAAYVLRDVGQSSQLRDCPSKCGMGGHPIYDVAYWYKVQMICNALSRPEILCDSKNMERVK